jgi:hypothetical protein
MGRTLLTGFAIIAMCGWLQYELDVKPNYRKYLGFAVSAVVAVVLASVFFQIYHDNYFGNFVYHLVGGGVMSTFFGLYILKTFKIQLNWRLEIVLLFAFVSMLGVMNELLEFGLETLRLGIFSLDTHDTWRDLLANTTGALMAWLLYKSGQIILSKQR